jgi:hypothetical protein
LLERTLRRYRRQVNTSEHVAALRRVLNKELNYRGRWWAARIRTLLDDLEKSRQHENGPDAKLARGLMLLLEAERDPAVLPDALLYDTRIGIEPDLEVTFIHARLGLCELIKAFHVKYLQRCRICRRFFIGPGRQCGLECGTAARLKAQRERMQRQRSVTHAALAAQYRSTFRLAPSDPLPSIREMGEELRQHAKRHVLAQSAIIGRTR